MIVAQKDPPVIRRRPKSLRERTRNKKWKAGRSPPGPGPIEDSIGARAQVENIDWARAWRSFQPWGPY